MSALTQIKACTSFRDLAHLLGFKAKSLSYLLWGMDPSVRYTAFDIPKRSGGKRTISAPNVKLKLVQRRMAAILQKCEQEIETIHNVKQPLAHGFKKGQSILTNAEVHRSKRYVLNIDLEDFFGTIHFGRVRGYFIKNHQFALDPVVAMAIAQIACHEKKLPQGSPCSPVISNLVANILDVRLARLARAHGCAYTRYADDITFSTSQPEFPQALAVREPGSHTWGLGKELLDAITACKFAVNHAKTRMQYRNSRQDVTGIVVNRHLNVRAEYKKGLRAKVHRLRSTGLFSHKRIELDATGQTQIISKEGSRAELQGMLSFVLQVEKWRYRKRNALPKALSVSEWLMRDFLFYTLFANTELPCVLCEGKTDSIYLKEAVKSLGGAYPVIAKKSASGSDLLVRLLRTTERVERLFGLSGGETPLKEFVSTYRDEYRKVKGPRGLHPVIVLFDNDSGASAVLNLLSSMFKISATPGQQYFHVYGNLYVLLTSPVGTGPHYIEQNFEPATLALPIGGKTFSPTNHKLGPNEYGKGWFAEKVVAPNAKTINFSGFAPLLSAMSEIISNYVPPLPTTPAP